MRSGVYRIVNLVNGNQYYGSTTNLYRRKHRHFKGLREGNHENNHLQRAYDKYGESNFEFQILGYYPTDRLLNEEQKLLDIHYGKEYCYNILPTAGSPFRRGRKKTKEHRKKLAEATRKYFESHPSARRYLSRLRKGTTLPEEVKKKMRASHKHGVLHHNAKLTDDIIRNIRRRYSPGECSYDKLAKEYRVDKKTIIRIVKNRTWTHVV